jgi:hypothetical protein
MFPMMDSKYKEKIVQVLKIIRDKGIDTPKLYDLSNPNLEIDYD